MTEWPKYRMARDLVGTVFPTSESVILQTARKIGVGRKMGRAIIFSAKDCQTIYEALPCHSNSFSDRNRQTGSYAAPSGEFALKKALELTTNGSHKKYAQSARLKSSHS